MTCSIQHNINKATNASTPVEQVTQVAILLNHHHLYCISRDLQLTCLFLKLVCQQKMVITVQSMT